MDGKKIAFFWSHSLGDFVVSTPLLRKLKSTYLESHITYITIKTPHRNLFLNSPYIDELFEIEKFDKKNLFFDLIKLYRKKFDLTFAPFPNRKPSRILANLIRTNKLIKSKEGYYGKENIINKGFKVLESYGIKIKENDKRLEWPFDVSLERDKVGQLLKQYNATNSKVLVAIHTGYKKGFAHRSWPSSKWAKIIDYVVEKWKSCVILIGSGEDELSVKEILLYIRNQKSIINLVDKLDIQEAAALIDRSSIFISTNSGPMWIAAAFQKPQIALCGPSFSQWEPYNEKALVIRKIVDRKGCNPPCDAKKCQYKDNLCMELIGVDDVKKAIDHVMEKIK